MSTTGRMSSNGVVLVAVSVLAVFLGVAASRAHAQDQSAQDAQGSTTPGRADVLAAERDKKATDTEAPSRSTVERALYWYDNQYLFARIFGGWNGIRLAGGDFPAGAGTKFGVGFNRRVGSPADPNRHNALDVDAVAAYSTRGYLKTSAGLRFNRLGGAPLTAGIRGQYFEYPQEDFFGTGQNSRTEDRTSYLHESREYGADLEWRPAGPLVLGGGIAFIRPTIGSGTDGRFPSTEELFDPATLPGFTTQSDYLRSDASAAFDWRDNPRHPHVGGLYGVRYSNYEDRDLDQLGFRQIQIDLQQYVPLPNRYRTLALRAEAVLTDAHAGQDVPFFYQPTLGGAQTLRGFREFRFRDRNSLLMTAEYRWEAAWLLDAALFVDAGKVAAERRGLTLRDLDVSYGLGFRLHTNSAFVARLDLAFSREGFIPLLRFEHVF
jgi:hypothetical protein